MKVKLAWTIREDILKISYHGNVGHVGSALSVTDILTALYFGAAKVYPQNPKNPRRDRILLSKGHGCAALYACLYRKGFIDKKTLYTYHVDNTLLAAHPEVRLRGVEFSSGSLGHGLAVGAGMALAGKLEGLKYSVFVILSDGECDEGSTWEAALGASAQRLNNLTAIVDYNKIQAFGRTNEVVNLEPLKDKWQSFGWRVIEADGHDLTRLVKTFNRPPAKNKPTVIICHTVLGKGVSFMENDLEWHYWNLTQEQLSQGLKELRTRR